VKHHTVSRVLFCLGVISLLFPWFTYNAKVMGYCHGYAFFRWLVIPLGVCAISIFGSSRLSGSFLSEAAVLCCCIMILLAPGRWQEISNIRAGFHWAEGLRTAVITYWLSLGLFGSLAMSLFARHHKST